MLKSLKRFFQKPEPPVGPEPACGCGPDADVGPCPELAAGCPVERPLEKPEIVTVFLDGQDTCCNDKEACFCYCGECNCGCNRCRNCRLCATAEEGY